MGISDYSCFCCSIEEGAQQLDDHESCYIPSKIITKDEDEDDLIIHEAESKTLFSKEDCREHDIDSCGSAIAHVFIFEFGSEGLVPWEVLKMIREKRYRSKEITEIKYSWDKCRFKGIGYNPDTDADFGWSVWEISDTEQWVVNICPYCYRNFCNREMAKSKRELCSVYLRNIAEKHSIPIEENEAKADVILKIREKMAFLRD